MATNHPKLLFFDIDGTLVSQKTHKIPPSALNAIKMAQENGHLAIINTGRTYHTIQDFIRDYPFDGYLCGCGTRLIYHGEILKKSVFTPEEVTFLVDTMEKYKVEAFLEGSEDVYMKRADYRQPVLNKIRTDFRAMGFNLGPCIEDKNFPFDKFCILTDGQEDLDGFFEAVSLLIDPIDRGHGMFECVPKGVSKASAIREFSEFLHIPLTDTYAFGDSTNDLPMFSVCNHRIAMGEHAPELDEISDFITDTVENDGIEKALRHFDLI